MGFKKELKILKKIKSLQLEDNGGFPVIISAKLSNTIFKRVWKIEELIKGLHYNNFLILACKWYLKWRLYINWATHMEI